MLIHEVASLLGVSPDTVRYYERNWGSSGGSRRAWIVGPANWTLRVP